MSMKMRLGTALAAALVAVMFSATPVMAGTQNATPRTSKVAKKTHARQNTRMAECNRQAKGKKGDAHKKFMSQCMSKQGTKHAKHTRHHSRKATKHHSRNSAAKAAMKNQAKSESGK